MVDPVSPTSQFNQLTDVFQLMRPIAQRPDYDFTFKQNLQNNEIAPDLKPINLNSRALFHKYEYLEWIHASLLKLVDLLDHFEKDNFSECIEPYSKQAKQAKQMLQHLSVLLFCFYTDFHSSPWEAERYRQYALKFSTSINQYKAVTELSSWTGVTHRYRKINFQYWNWWRLLLVRISQTLGPSGVVAFLYGACTSGSELVKVLFDTLGTGFACLSFIYYFPRLLLNIGLFIKHTFYAHHLAHQESAITLADRVSMQWQRRKFQLFNDLVWFADGLAVYLIGQFVSMAVASPLALVLVGALYLFDVWNARAELQKAERMQQDMLKHMGETSSIYHCALTKYCLAQVQEKQFNYYITLVLMIGKIPAVVMGSLAFVLGVSILTTPCAIVLFSLGALLVLGAHLVTKVLKNKRTELNAFDIKPLIEPIPLVSPTLFKKEQFYEDEEQLYGNEAKTDSAKYEDGQITTLTVVCRAN